MPIVYNNTFLLTVSVIVVAMLIARSRFPLQSLWPTRISPTSVFIQLGKSPKQPSTIRNKNAHII